MSIKESLERNRKAYESFSGEISPRAYKNSPGESAPDMPVIPDIQNSRNIPAISNRANFTETQDGPVYSLGGVKTPGLSEKSVYSPDADLTQELLKRLDDESRLYAQSMEED